MSVAGAPKTILFAPASDVLFHVGRSLVLARELSRRGHRIAIAGLPRYLRDPTVGGADDFAFHPLPDFPAELGVEILRSAVRTPSRRYARELVRSEVALLDRLRPDVVVTDFRPTMNVSARVRGVPLVSLLLTHWMRRYALWMSDTLRTYPATLRLRRAIGARATAAVMPWVLDIVIRNKTRAFRAAGRTFGRSEPARLWDLLEGDLNLLTDTEAWCPAHDLPASFHRVGPIVWEPEVPLPDLGESPSGGPPRIYVTFGSTAHRDLFDCAFRELGGGPFQVVLSTGGQIDPARASIPANFRVHRFLPGSAVMARSELVIHHGGAGTAQQALRCGIPTVVVPTHVDQEYAAFAGERTGIGRTATLHEIRNEPGLLRRTVERVLADLPNHRERARALQAEAQKYDGPGDAARRIENFLDTQEMP